MDSVCTNLGAILAGDKDLLGVKVILGVVAALELDLTEQMGCRAGLSDVNPAGSGMGLSSVTSAVGYHAPYGPPHRGMYDFYTWIPCINPGSA